MPAKREFARITKETTFGVAQSSPASTDRALMHIGAPNAANIFKKPITWVERSAEGFNLPHYRGSEQYAVSGTLRELLFTENVALILDLATGITGSSTPKELPSFTFDHVYALEDGPRTANYFSSLGNKIVKGTFNANNKGQGVLWTAMLDVIGTQTRTITSSDFAEPTLSAYPTTNPYVMQDTVINVNGAFTNWESLSLTVENIIPPDLYFESEFVQRLPWCGRNVSMAIRFLYKTEAWRNEFVSQAAKDVTITIANGIKTVTLDFNGNNKITDLGQDLALDTSYFLDMTLAGTLSVADGIDFTAAVA